MKIPETTANVGAYYGNDENGQWQPNGVIIDSGVGGGVVGSGDAGLHRPPVYPVHIPRGHIPAGYVMAGAYYPPAAYPPVPAASQDDFADYMWMENEEEFDKQVMQQLEEEALMEQCIEAMLEDEQRERHRPVANGHTPFQPTTSNGSVSSGLSLEETVSRSTLNPLAAEFVPTRARAPPAAPAPAPAPAQAQPQPQPQPPVAQTEETIKEEIVEPTPTEEVHVTTAEPTEPAEQQVAVETKQEIVEIQEPEAVSQEAKTPVDPPEVSAADVQPIQDPKERRPKDQKKDSKPKAKADPKQKKPAVAVAVRSDTKVQKKVVKDTKAVKSDARVEDRVEGEPAAVTSPAPDVPKPSALTEEVTPEVKPINYAAAAKAVKPKKPGTPPAPNPTERTPPPQPALKADKPKGDKPKPIDKTDKKSLNKDKNKEKPAKVCNDKKKITK